MKKRPLIGIIDYGMGNLRSVGKAIERLGGSVYVGSNRRKLEQADKLILPGVGAFGDGMRELKRRWLVPVLRTAVAKGKPLLGICLGLQLFFERSAENSSVKGLGIWKGAVVRFSGKGLKIPHMGWNQVKLKQKNSFVAHFRDNSYFYFVHSYYAKPKDKKLVTGETKYGIMFPAILTSGNIFAVQFHPEKSQETGLRILKNFIEL